MASKPQDETRVQDEWESVSQEPRIQIKMDQEGDAFIGFYEGNELLTDPTPDKEGKINEWLAYNFIGVFPPEIEGERTTIFAGAHLRAALDQIEPNKFLVRIVRGRTVAVKNQPSPMVSYKVDKRLP